MSILIQESEMCKVSWQGLGQFLNIYILKLQNDWNQRSDAFSTNLEELPAAWKSEEWMHMRMGWNLHRSKQIKLVMHSWNKIGISHWFQTCCLSASSWHHFRIINNPPVTLQLLKQVNLVLLWWLSVGISKLSITVYPTQHQTGWRHGLLHGEGFNVCTAFSTFDNGGIFP